MEMVIGAIALLNHRRAGLLQRECNFVTRVSAAQCVEQFSKSSGIGASNSMISPVLGCSKQADRRAALDGGSLERQVRLFGQAVRLVLKAAP